MYYAKRIKGDEIVVHLTQGQCFELLEKVTSRMKNISNTSVKEVCKISIIDINNWEWAQGVGLYGMYFHYKNTKNKKILEWIISWIDKNIEKGLPEKNINTTAPMLTVSMLAYEENQTQYIPLCEEWASWVMTALPKTKYNGFQHIVSDDENYMQLWDDTLFMTVLFLTRMAIYTKNDNYLKECEHQFLLHTQYLQDTKTGLWYHGWTFDGNHNFACALWGRGNCWITSFIPEFIEIAGNHVSIKSTLTDVLNAQMENLEKYQDNSGLWHTLINDKDSYLEVSATAGFAYGILKSIRIGLLDEKYKPMALKAVDAVIKNIDNDGTVLNVSYGTGMGKTLQHYRDIPICPMTYGQSMTVMMLVEVIKHI